MYSILLYGVRIYLSYIIYKTIGLGSGTVVNEGFSVT